MGTKPSSIAASLLPKTRRLILGLVYGHPEKSFYLREIAEYVDAGMGQVQRELARLTESGVLRRTQRGRQVFFQANDDCPVFDELRSLMVKTVAGVDVLRPALGELADRIEAAFVFGSVARGEEGPESDFDLLIVGDVTLREVVAVLGEAQEEIGREVTPTIFPVAELRKKVRVGDHFVRTVMAGEKLFVIGGETALEGVLRPAIGRSSQRMAARGD